MPGAKTMGLRSEASSSRGAGSWDRWRREAPGLRLGRAELMWALGEGAGAPDRPSGAGFSRPNDVINNSKGTSANPVLF